MQFIYIPTLFYLMRKYKIGWCGNSVVRGYYVHFIKLLFSIARIEVLVFWFSFCREITLSHIFIPQKVNINYFNISIYRFFQITALWVSENQHQHFSKCPISKTLMNFSIIFILNETTEIKISENLNVFHVTLKCFGCGIRLITYCFSSIL